MYRWINEEKRRYYSVRLVKDLLGDWTLILNWGSLDSNRGGMKVRVVASEAAWEAEIQKIEKRRKQHGYRRVTHHAQSAPYGRGQP